MYDEGAVLVSGEGRAPGVAGVRLAAVATISSLHVTLEVDQVHTHQVAYTRNSYTCNH